jgi:hypothetical protein
MFLHPGKHGATTSNESGDKQKIETSNPGQAQKYSKTTY